MQTFYTDLLCIGAGLAGERVAIDAAEAGFDVINLSVVHSRRSHSSAAQGGMQAALGNCAMGEGDSPDIHFQDMVKGAEAAAAAGRQVLIFPEGHRQDVGAPPEYHTGIAMIYAGLNLPCVPVALNSGLFWGRGSLAKRPGEVVIRFLPPIEAGLDRKTFMARLQDAIEPAAAELAAEARARWPHLPR